MTNTDLPFSPDAIQAQLQRILSNPKFAAAPQLTNFLRFVVQETLAGREEGIKQYTVALKAFGRGRDFDPATDPVVRIQAGRLRRFLQRYCRTRGVGDPIYIEIPLGTYVPVFRPNTPASSPAPQLVTSWPLAPADPMLRLPSGPPILVLPLDVPADDPEQVYFADGLTEQLAVALTAFSDFLIVGPLDRERLTERDHVPLQALGQQYDARFILHGRLRKGGKKPESTSSSSTCHARSPVGHDI